MIAQKAPAAQLPSYPADRSPLSLLVSEQVQPRLQLCTGRPSPDLLRRVARVEALINAGGLR